MGVNVEEFNRNLKRHSRVLLPSQVVLLQKKVALDLFTRIILKTPVDTGRARGNWQISIGSPAQGVVELKGTGALTKGANKISSVKNHELVTIYITNNVEYITFLEGGDGKEGSSSQAPNGMVAVSIEEVNASMFV